MLRERVGLEGDEPVAEFCDDGHSGARLDRPGLDALRDAAEAGLIERVWCLSPDRLARVYAYQVIVLDELARHGVSVRFTDAPPLDDDPQAKLLTQVQGVIAEYERAKIAERYRRGKLFRSRNGEVLAWRTPYGYRRQPRDAHGPARLQPVTAAGRGRDLVGGQPADDLPQRVPADRGVGEDPTDHRGFGFEHLQEPVTGRGERSGVHRRRARSTVRRCSTTPEPVGDLRGQLGAGPGRRRSLQELHDLGGELDRAATAAFVVEQPAHPGLLEHAPVRRRCARNPRAGA